MFPAMARRGRPAKRPLVTIGSSVSARIIANTLEQGNEQRVVTPKSTLIQPTSIGSSTAAKKLNLSGESQLKGNPGTSSGVQSLNLRSNSHQKEI